MCIQAWTRRRPWMVTSAGPQPMRRCQPLCCRVPWPGLGWCSCHILRCQDFRWDTGVAVCSYFLILNSVSVNSHVRNVSRFREIARCSVSCCKHSGSCMIQAFEFYIVTVCWLALLVRGSDFRCSRYFCQYRFSSWLRFATTDFSPCKPLTAWRHLSKNSAAASA